MNRYSTKEVADRVETQDSTLTPYNRHVRAALMQREIVRRLVFVVVILGVPLISQGAELLPGQVVQHWITVYPVDMTQAAELLPQHGRIGSSKDDWAERNGNALRDLKLRYLHGTVL